MEKWEIDFGQLVSQLVSKAWKNGLWHSESELHKSLKDFIRQIILQERQKTLESLKLWRPYFYRDKKTEEDIEELSKLL